MRTIESRCNRSVNQGKLYPALLKLEQEGFIASVWGLSEKNRKARYYRLTRAGRKRLAKQADEWKLTTHIVGRFLSQPEEAS